MKNDENSLQKAQAEFISTVSHELRTPLTSIRGFADTLLTSGDKLSEEQKQKFILIIKEQANRLIKLTENLLAVSKNEVEKLVLKSVDVTLLIENCVGLVAAQNKKNTFNCKIDKNLPKILVDTDKFQQIMLNIVENATKYSNPETEVQISVTSDDKFVIIKVSDIGIKIDEKDKLRIFEKFTRLSTPLTQKIEGSGLGLYLTKTLVERMKGTIGADSDGDKTVFKVKFPISAYDDDARAKMK
jgi:signal transduction histidine kinase